MAAAASLPLYSARRIAYDRPSRRLARWYFYFFFLFSPVFAATAETDASPPPLIPVLYGARARSFAGFFIHRHRRPLPQSRHHFPAGDSYVRHRRASRTRNAVSPECLVSAAIAGVYGARVHECNIIIYWPPCPELFILLYRDEKSDAVAVIFFVFDFLIHRQRLSRGGSNYQCDIKKYIYSKHNR